MNIDIHNYIPEKYSQNDRHSNGEVSLLVIKVTLWEKQCQYTVNEPLWYTKYPCSSPSGVNSAVLRYFLGTLCSPLRFNGIPPLKTFSALNAVGRFDLMSRNNGSWLDLTWVNAWSWHRVRKCLFTWARLQLASLLSSFCSLVQTTACWVFLSQSGDRYSG